MDQDPSQEEDEPRRSKRARTSTSFGPDFLTYLLENEPRTYSEAMSSPEAPHWKEAVNNEIESIMQNHTWELVDLPPGNKPLGRKWIFKRKMKADGTIEKYKARLVVKGYRQKERLDYFDTYSPVTRITSIRILIAIATINNLEIHQMDVKTAFLNGDLYRATRGKSSVPLFWFAGSAIWSAPISDVLSLYPGRLSSRTVSTIAGRISLKDSESNSRLDLFPLLFCNLLAWKHSDFLCKNYILNGLDNALYNVYSPMVNAKALWESLERKYKTEDAGSKKFVVGKFLDFKMVDSKTVISQVQEFQLILHDIHAEGMVLGESFQVAALIEKLPPTWKDFKNYLKHKRKEMKLEDLIVRLRIEEDNRQSEKKAGNYHQEAKANVVEQAIARHIGS
ncbi:hypothetical protein RJ639_034598 [Escallonia herrerae]|uniref:Reverse transcriptase Ty1/copia-type domain-containing protein n=2 Tax=Escallonia herrerae TaxID=1293975 RepID=A0AA88XB03_9ASTE|nr:hypothetical protein RJ639_034598 [Escallonia herrerae]